MAFKLQRPESPEDPVDILTRADGSVYIFLPGKDGGIEYGINYEDVGRLIRSGNEVLNAAVAKYAKENGEPYLEPKNATEVGE